MIDAIDSFRSFYNSNFDYTNISGLTSNPQIYTYEEYNIDNDIDNSECFMLIKNMGYSSTRFTKYYDETYNLTLYLYNSDQDTRNEIVKEIDRIARLNNIDISRDFELDVESMQDGNIYDASINITLFRGLST